MRVIINLSGGAFLRDAAYLREQATARQLPSPRSGAISAKTFLSPSPRTSGPEKQGHRKSKQNMVVVVVFLFRFLFFLFLLFLLFLCFVSFHFVQNTNLRHQKRTTRPSPSTAKMPLFSRRMTPSAAWVLVCP